MHHQPALRLVSQSAYLRPGADPPLERRGACTCSHPVRRLRYTWIISPNEDFVHGTEAILFVPSQMPHTPCLGGPPLPTRSRARHWGTTAYGMGKARKPPRPCSS